MNTLQALTLAVVQGLTEFIPVSSSAHLVLVSAWLGWPDQGLLFDVALHFGTLIALMLYFRQRIIQCVQEFFSCALQPQRAQQTLALRLILCSLPIMVVGALGHDWVSECSRSMHIIGYTTLGFGGLLGIALLKRHTLPSWQNLSLKQVTLVGCFQALSVIPGTSRSGITLTACLFLGLSPRAAAEFSLLCGIPTLLMAGVYELFKSHAAPIEQLGLLVLATTLTMVVALISIRFFLNMVARFGLWPFVAYRMALGVYLLCFFGVL